MNEAGLLLYAITFMASVSLSLNGYKNRYLPIARPLTALVILLAIFCLMHFLELLRLDRSQWVEQSLLDFKFLLLSLAAPLWFWMIIEYQLERKIKITDKRVLIFLIHPLVLFVLVFVDIYSNGFLSQQSSVALIQSEQRIGSYAAFRQIYGWVIVTILMTISPYLMIKKQQSSVWGIIQVIVYTSMPFVLFALHHLEVISLRLAAPAFVLYLFWISRQFRFLDVLPVALKSIIDKVDAGMIVSDPQSGLLYVNHYAQNLFDLKLSSIFLQQHDIKVPDIVESNFDFFRPEKQTAQFEIVNNSKEGGERCYVDAILQPIFNQKTSKHLGATVALHDVTERKQAELDLQKLDQQRSEFFAGISHEFRTPLTLSLGDLDDVLETQAANSSDELQASLLRVKENNKRLLHLVNQLLELAQLESGALQIQPVLIHLDTYLPAIVANFETLSKKQNCRIHFQVDDQAAHHAKIYFDLTAFDKVILNLVSNALKSMPDGGDVYVRLSVENEEYVQLSVRDTGCGIPAEVLPKVFEMFYSQQNKNAVWPQGLGVGLPLVKHLLEQHGAKIDVSSIEGQGTTFTVNFRNGTDHFSEDAAVLHQAPVTDVLTTHNTDLALSNIEGSEETPLVDNTAILKEIEQKTLLEKVILLVEDNAEMRAYIRKHIPSDFRLLEAGDGEEALALAKQTMPDLVLSDVMMPKMNGYDLCKSLKTDLQTSHIPILLLTAKSSQSEKLEGLELGADGYISKPFDVRELSLKIVNLVASRNAIKQFYKNNGLQKVICNPRSGIPKREAVFLETLQDFMQANISNANLKVSDLAESVHMSERSLGRKLKALTGEAPGKMILKFRLEYAARILLDDRSETITNLCHRTGFSDASHFTRSFKAHYSVTPSEYRKSG